MNGNTMPPITALQEQVAQLHDKLNQLDQKIDQKIDQVQRSNNDELNRLDQRLQVQINDTPPEIDESSKYPPDCYSLIAKNCNGSTKSILCFSYGITVFLFQAAFFGLLLFSLGNEELGTTLDPGNPGTKENHNNSFLTFFEPMIAPNVKVVTLITQFLAFFAYIFFPESGLEDLVTACRFFPGFSGNSNGNHSKDPIWGLRFACTLRAIQGIFAIITAWLLIMSSESVIDIILNFAAMGFVSSLDESAFEFALNGIFGTLLQNETEKIQDGTHQLPEAAKKSLPKHFWYWIVMGFTGLIFLCLTSFVVSAQESTSQWITTEMRVQFNSNEFKEFSGCYEIDNETKSDRRFSYNHMNSTAVITYCLQERRWVLFDEDDTNTTVCDSMVNNTNIGSSSRTDTFDVLASFEDPWLTASGAPLELYTFDNANEEGNELFCNLTLGDGRCDAAFNEPGNQYDAGDCCAATCVGNECGKNGIVGVFGSNTTANGYDCRNPEMKDITIRMDRVYGGVFTRDSRYFSVACNGKNVITAYIDKSMENGTQTIQVEDGAKCSVLLRETDNTYWVEYTMFYGNSRDSGFEIFDSKKSEIETDEVHFTHIPECFVDELEDLFGNVSGIYNVTVSTSSSFDASNLAIKWLADDYRNTEYCGSDDLVPRFALLTLYFALGAPDNFLTMGDHCSWPIVTCEGGQVTKIDLDGHYVSFIRGLPSEIGLLSNLQDLDLGDKGLTSLPTEIGNLSNLQTLDLTNNELHTLPSEIGDLSNLKFLYLDNNELHTLPSEIGNLSNVHTLHLDNNELHTLPSEIGDLSNLRFLYLDNNELHTLPSEIGDLSNLLQLSLVNTGLKKSGIPSELVQLTNLVSIFFYDSDPGDDSIDCDFIEDILGRDINCWC